MAKKKGEKGNLAKKRRKARRLAQKQQAASAPELPQASPKKVVPEKEPANTFKRLIIEPADVWLFRSGKPFRAGEDHWASSIFPPTPFTIQGVIRSKILFDSHTDLQAYANDPAAQAVYRQIGGPDDYGQLQLNGPYLASFRCKTSSKTTR